MFFSLIISAYNIEDYIGDCLESCLKQKDISPDDYEVIVIDDGSTDNTSSIVKEFSRQNENLKYYKKINGGLSSARNEGLKYAKGDYIWWIDGDDFIEENSLAVIKDELLNNKTSVLIIDYYEREEAGKRIISHKFTFPDNRFQANDYVKKNNTFMPMMTWLTIIEKSFLETNDLKFTEGIVNEDLDFSVRLFSLNPEVMHVSMPLYNYRFRRSGSIMSYNQRREKSLISQIMVEKVWQSWFNKRIKDKKLSEILIANLSCFILLNSNIFKNLRKIGQHSNVYYIRKAKKNNSWIKVLYYFILSPSIYDWINSIRTNSRRRSWEK